MAKSKRQFIWKIWLPGISSILLTLFGVVYPDEAKALGVKFLEHWDWIGPLLAIASYVVLIVFVIRELRRIRTTCDKANRRSRKIKRRVRQFEIGLRDQNTKVGAAVDRIETLERKIIRPDV